MTLNPAERRYYAALLFALSCALALAWLLTGIASLDTLEQLYSESGPIESASALFLIVAALTLLTDMVLRKDFARWHLVVLVLAAGLRELDWDKAFTDSGIASLGLYTGPAPLAQKLGGALVLTALIWAGLRLLRVDFRPWLSGLRLMQGWAWLIATVLTLYAVAKSLDGIARKLAPWGFDLSEVTSRTAMRAEEPMELFGAMLILQVVGLSLLRAFEPRERQVKSQRATGSPGASPTRRVDAEVRPARMR